MREPNEPGISFHPAARRIVHFGEFRADLTDGSLWRGAEEVRLPPRALALLLYLVERPGRVVAKDALIDAVWKEAHVSETSLTEAVGLVRQALGDSAGQPQFIQTVHRRGYRFIAPISMAPAEPGTLARRADLPPAEPESIHPAEQPGPSPGAARGNKKWIAVAAGLILAVAAIAVMFAVRGRETSPSVMRATITLPPAQAPAPALSAHTVVALSPDGQTLVYLAGTNTNYRLFLRRMDQFEAQPIPGTDGGHGPFFSPDGSRVGYFADGHLRIVPVAGGEPLSIAAAPNGMGGSWTARGTIVYAPDLLSGLFEVDEAGSAPRQIAAAPSASAGYRWPAALPDGRTVIATRWESDAARGDVVALSLLTGEARTLVEGGTYGRYLASGHLLFMRGTTLMAATYAPDGQAPGPARPALESVMTGSSGAAQFSVSSSGSLVYLPDDPARRRRSLVRLDARDGSAVATHDPRTYQNLSVCGDRLAIIIAERDRSDVWVGSVTGGAFTPLTQSGQAIEPVWRPDCAEIAYAVQQRLFVQHADGGTAPRSVQSSALPQAPASWTPDGSRLVYIELHPTTSTDIWMIDLRDGRRTPLVQTRHQEGNARVSPDGRWLAYQVTDRGPTEVRVRSLDGSGAGTQISTAGGWAPAWSPDGRWLHYRVAAGIASVPVDPVRGPDAAVAPKVIERRNMVAFRPLDRPDHFLVVQRDREHLPLTTLNLIVNWTGEVARRLRQ